MTDQTPATPSPIVLKELDHIQVIIGRFDTFFFLMKQVSLAGMATFFVASMSDKSRTLTHWIFVIPLVFLMLEYSYRFSYWTRYVSRVEKIRGHLQGTVPSLSTYQIVERGRFWDGARWRRSIKSYDIFFYVTWAVVAFLAGRIFS
jgi:hypothetical protein